MMILLLQKQEREVSKMEKDTKVKVILGYEDRDLDEFLLLNQSQAKLLEWLYKNDWLLSEATIQIIEKEKLIDLT